MKKIVFLTVIAAFLLNVTSLQAAEPKKKKSDNKENVQIGEEQNKLSEAEIQVYVARVDEIKNMDKKDLTAQQRRELRKEVREIKDIVKQNAEGIYIGGGALLVVIILLILLL